MSAPNRNTLWARVLVDELARAGLGHATMAPGSRSTPLVLALARREDVKLAVHLDERSAAFHALGVGKATGRPAAVVTTSGTAAANLLPAVVEAHQSQAPLILLTADRPPELRGADANQTIDQVKLYGDRVRAFHELPEPRPEPEALRHLRSLADQLLAEATGPPAGPVHVNCPFAKPLEPTPVEDDVPADLGARAPLAVEGRPDGAPWTRVEAREAQPSTGDVEALADRLAQAQRPLIVAGPHPDPDGLGPPAVALADASGAPLLADPMSGARFTPGATSHALAHHDLFLRSEPLREALTPDLVLRLGASPTSKRVNRWLASNPQIPQVVVDAGRSFKDHQRAAEAYLRADPAALARTLADQVPHTTDKAWRGAWREAETRTASIVADELQRDPFEATVLARAASTLPPEAQLFVGNSMPVRDLDAYASPRDEPVRVLGNRGASGIDGLVSTALGAAAASGRPTLAVLGDLSLLHDVNGFHALRDVDAPVVFVVVNNDGGGIFHQLPIREHDDFSRYFATPHGRDLAHVADLHDLDHERCPPGQLAGPLERALDEPDGQLIEVPSEREANQRRHERVEERVLDTVNGIGR